MTNEFSAIENNRIAESNLQRCLYEKKACQAGIVHIGVGAFHRAHQAYYIHRLLNKNYDDWGIIGINLLSSSSEDLQRLQQNNNTYILKTISPSGNIEYQEITH